MLFNMNLIRRNRLFVQIKSLLGLRRRVFHFTPTCILYGQFLICFELTVQFTCSKTTFKLNSSPHTQVTPHVWWCVSTCWKSFVASSAPDGPWLALWFSPDMGPLLCANRRDQLQRYRWKTFHCKFLSVPFPSVALGVEEESARLLENRAVETWNSLNVSSFSFYLEGLGSGVRSSSQGDNQGKWKPLTHPPSTKKRKNSPKCTSFPPSSLSRLFLSVSFSSLWLVYDHSRGDHHPAGLQRVVAAPPGLPEDALLPLVPLLWRRALEVSAV